MQPETATQPAQDWRQRSVLQAVPEQWHRPLFALLLSISALLVLTAREWGEMFHQWWNIDTYSHILIVPVLIGWLVVMKRDELKQVTPQGWVPGLGLLLAALSLWFLGRIFEVNLLAHAGAVGAIQAVIVAVLGPRVLVLLFLPIAYGVFLVPFGDEIIPQLQMITAAIAIALTEWSGIPAEIDGIYINTPVGLFIVAEACSGVKFLIAMITLAVLVAFTRFQSWTRRALFMLVALIVPIIANGIRAWGTIYIAQFQGVEFAAGFDHIFFGWIFFALVVGIVLAAAWRFFEVEPETYGYSNRDIDGSVWFANLDKGATSSAVIAGTVAALVVAAGMLQAIVANASLV